MTYAVIHATIGTGASTQQFTRTGFGTPVGALAFWVNATADGVNRDNMSIAAGATDFTRQGCVVNFTEHGSDPSMCVSHSSQTHFISVVNATGTAVDFNGTVTAINDGIEVDWGANPGTAYHLMIILFGGADMSCEAGVEVSNSSLVDVAHTKTMVDMPDEPEGLFVFSAHNSTFDNGFANDAHLSFGFGNGPTGSIAQGAQGYNDDDGRNPAGRHAGWVSNTRICVIPSFSSVGNPLVAWELTALGKPATRGTFQLTKREAGATTSYLFFAFSTKGTNPIHVGTPALAVDAPTGNKDYTDPGFTPQLVVLFPANLSALLGNNGNNAAGIGASAADALLADGHYSGVSSETDPADASSRFQSDFLAQRTHLGGNSYTASLVSFLATGFRFNVAANAANTKFTPVLCMGEAGGTSQNPTPSVVPLAAPAVTLDLPRVQNPTPSVVPLAAPAVTLDLPTAQNPTPSVVPLAAPAVTLDLPTAQNPTPSVVPLAAPAVTLDLPTEQNPTPSVVPLAAPAVTLDLPTSQNPTPSVVPLAAPAVTVTVGTSQFPTPSVVPLAAPAVTLDLPRVQNPTPSVVPLAAPAVTLDLPRVQSPTPSVVPLAAPAVTLDLPTDQSPTPSVVPLAAPAVTLDLPTAQNPTPSVVPLAAPPVTVDVGGATQQNPSPSVVPLAAPPVTLDLPTEQSPTPSVLPLAAPPVTLDLPTVQNPTPLQVPLAAPAVTLDLPTTQNPTPSVVPLFAPPVTLDLPLVLNPTPSVVPLFAPPVLRFGGLPSVTVTLDLEVVQVLTLDLEVALVVTLDLEA